MKFLRAVILMSIVGLTYGVSNAQSFWENCNQIPKPSTRSQRVEEDNEGNVWLLEFGHRRKVGQDLRVKAAQVLPLGFVSPSDIPIQLDQINCKLSDWKIVALLTIHPQQFQRQLTVVLFRGSKSELLLQKKYPDIDQLILADVNGDGNPELAVEWTDSSLISPGSWLDIWRINAHGEISPVDLQNVHKEMDMPFASHAGVVELGSFNIGDFSIYSEQRRIEKDGATLKVRKQYIWDQTRGTYQFKSAVKIEERTSPVQR